MGWDIRIAPWERQGMDAALAAPYVGPAAERVRRFHEGIAGYEPTPLVSLPGLSARLGIAGIYLKDESRRFSLNAFKSLGGSWAVARLIAQAHQIPPHQVSWEMLRGPALREKLRGMTLVTATDGNHGRGIAWVARQLGIPAVVFMPEDTVPERLRHIRALGAQASILPMNYDDTRRHAEAAKSMAKGAGYRLGSYPRSPVIMQGCDHGEEPPRAGARPPPTCAQCGEASAIQLLWDEQPFTALEPRGADCFYRTALAHDGRLHAVTGRLRSIMAGLCVGEPSTLAWELLSGLSDAFVSCPDEVSVLGMRAASAPMPGDPRVISGESGAVGLGLMIAAMTDGGEAAREKLRLDRQARVLLISTEGDTDSAGWRDLVWGLRRD